MKFGNTKKNETVDNIINGFKNRIDNNFYLMQSNYVFGTYYSIIDDASTTTLTTGMIEDYDGENCPIKYNMIKNMPLCSLTDIDVSLNLDEFGLENESIELDLFLFARTVTPVENDLFTFNHMPHLLFIVNKATIVKLDSGKNMWRISSKLYKSGIEASHMNNNVIKTSEAIIDNIDSNMNVVIEDGTLSHIREINEHIRRLKLHYMSTFYSDRVDSLILEHNGKNIYDGFLIEFIIRNDLLYDDDNKVIFYHHLDKDNTFVIDFEDSIFGAIMKNDITKFRLNTMSLIEINDLLSIFSSRNEKYYTLKKINNVNKTFLSGFSCLDNNLEIDIKNIKCDDTIIQIIVNCMKGKTLYNDDIIIIDSIKMVNNKYFFYLIPILIYELNEYINRLMK